jgi:soluble lytic murein transglycosylase-like protein
MQVLPASGRFYAGLSVQDLFDVEKNIQAGCKILKIYQSQEKTLRAALHRYSGGASGYYEKVMRAMKG